MAAVDLAKQVGTTKGDLYVYNGSTLVRLPVGADDQVLTADAAQAAGVKWAAGGGSGGGGVVAVKRAVKTNTQSESLAANGWFEIADLTISHAAASTSNLIMVTAVVNGGLGNGANACGLTLDGSLASAFLGDAAGSRSRVAGYNRTGEPATGSTVTVQGWFTPVDTASHTYGVAGISINSGADVFHVNRNDDDTDNSFRVRAVSSFVLWELSV